MDYKDRGIIKWAPFDALVGFNQMINDLKYKMGKIEKPTLDEDQLMEMDYVIKEAIKFNKELQIEYYNDGYIKSIYGYIKKVNLYDQNLILGYDITIDLSSIVNINIV